VEDASPKVVCGKVGGEWLSYEPCAAGSASCGRDTESLEAREKKKERVFERFVFAITKTDKADCNHYP